MNLVPSSFSNLIFSTLHNSIQLGPNIFFNLVFLCGGESRHKHTGTHARTRIRVCVCGVGFEPHTNAENQGKVVKTVKSRCLIVTIICR